MSSGSASRLVNGENEKENPHGYEYGDRKERNECGAAGSTASTADALEPTSSVTPLCTPPPLPPPPPPPPSPPPLPPPLPLSPPPPPPSPPSLLPTSSGGSRSISIYTCNSTLLPIASTTTTISTITTTTTTTTTTSAIITITTTTTSTTTTIGTTTNATFPTTTTSTTTTTTITTCITNSTVTSGAGSIGSDTYTIDTSTTANDLGGGTGITLDFVVSGVSVDDCATGGSLADIGVSRNISVAAVTTSNEIGGGSGVVGVNATAVSGVLVSSVEFRDIGNSEFGRPVNLEEIRAGGGGQTYETTDHGATERLQEQHSSSTSAERTPSAARTSTPTVSYDDNMVAAMNEHLSTSSATSGVRTSTASTTTATGGNPGNNNNNNNNNACSRNEFQSVDEDGKPAAGILSFPCDFDHMYASMTDGGAPAAATATSALGVSPLRGNEPRQNDLTEVKHLKELLLLHLDLIQQQSEQIVTKDKLLAALRQENETLKLRLERMDRRVNLQKLRSESSENSITSEHIGACSPPSVNSVNVPSTSELHRSIQSENSNSQYNESFKIRLNTSGGITTVKQEPNDGQAKHEAKLEAGNESRLEWEEKKKRRSDPTPLSGGTKRKRGVSCSSTISNDASSGIQDKVLGHDGSRKSDRKGKLLTKKECFLTTEEHYYTAVGDSSYTLNLKESNAMDSGTSLEVPNWRVKIYTSCYTMEGTENLDDEIFNKRHLKLENDERRRKRWDVQRIREQRHIEKLKQRQERQNHQATCYNTNHTGPCPSTVEEEAVTSLWPDVEQIQSLQVDPQLPVTAFGAPIPSFTPSEFSLPWSNTPRSTSRRPKRSTSRRKSTRR